MPPSSNQRQIGGCLASDFEDLEKKAVALSGIAALFGDGCCDRDDVSRVQFRRSALEDALDRVGTAPAHARGRLEGDAAPLQSSAKI
jgi:hypothetical protein